MEQNEIKLPEVAPMSTDECNSQTQEHINNVRKFIGIMTSKLTERGLRHDETKQLPPESELFAKFTPLLAALTYGSPEYEESLRQLKPALEHHYANNRHHPEHFPDGVNGMNLIDVVEMFCDWKAASMRHRDGNLLKSIETNAERFNIERVEQRLEVWAKFLDYDDDYYIIEYNRYGEKAYGAVPKS